MRRKSLGICVLLVGLLLGISSSAYADTISTTSVTLSNLQLVPTSGSVVFSPPSFGQQTIASAVAVNGADDSSSQSSQSPTLSEASASVSGASASALSNFTNMFLSANSNVTLSGCLCSAETEGMAILRQNFMIVGGSGNVDVTLSALLQTMQNLVTDEFSLFAASDTLVTLQVTGVNNFSFDSRLRIGANESTLLETQRLISQLLTLQFNQQYTLSFSIIANSRGAQNEVPEPATVVLLISGLGFMAGVVKKRPG